MMRPERLRLLAVTAHPDDETLGMGGMLARSSAEGVETYVVSATRGERGWFGDPALHPGEEALGRIREGELHCAARVLGVQDVAFLDYLDGELDLIPPREAILQLVLHLRRVRPQVVLTFDPNGIYGHPDHIAISQYTTAAVVAAADRSYGFGGLPHRVAKLYYRVATNDEMGAYQMAFGDLVMQVDGSERRPVAWENWAITTRIDARAVVPQVWEAVQCHQTQIPAYERLLRLGHDEQTRIFGAQTYYRAFSLVNGGREVETDLFEGLRAPQPAQRVPSSAR